MEDEEAFYRNEELCLTALDSPTEQDVPERISWTSNLLEASSNPAGRAAQGGEKSRYANAIRNAMLKLLVD